MPFIDYWLGPRHHYQCPFGHRFSMRGHRLTPLQPCHLCSAEGIITDGKEIHRATDLPTRDRLRALNRGRH